MSHASEPRVDAHTGTPTTGHEWDGIAELNTPLPRWWLWTFYATIVWSIGYWVVYPAWPLATTHTNGLFGWNSRAAIVDELNELKTIRGAAGAKLEKASLAEIKGDAQMLSFARAQGAAAFATNCAPCHGAGAQGAKGYPNLNDDEWIWGGTPEAISQTITHGIRWDADKDSRAGAMPAFGKDGTLKADEIANVAGYVQSIGGVKVEGSPDLAKGKTIYAENCAACHGDDGKGNMELGSPSLVDKIWLYGSDKATIVNRIQNGGGGVMPSWGGRLDPVTIKSLTVYVHSLGGGK